MSELPQLTEDDIRAWVGDPSFERGSRYFDDGAIFNPRRAGSTLKAQCQGSQPEPYRVRATLGQDGIVEGDCSCPVGGGGRCKHAGALLLAWLHSPDEFTNVEEMATALDRRSKADLIALIGKMVDRYPDLEMLVEAPAPGEKSAKPVDPESVRRQVMRGLGAGGYQWGTAPGAARKVDDILDGADAYAKAGEWRNAAMIYETAIREVLDQYGSFDDEGGDLHAVVDRAVTALGECLAATDDPAQRMAILRILFDTHAWDINFGGIDMGYEATDIILAQATPEERRQAAAWARSVLPTGNEWSDNYRRQAYGGFLLELEGDEIDDEAWLRICRETGRVLDLVDRLLALGRIEEAREAAQAAGDYDLYRMADIFKAHGQVTVVTELMRERAKVSRDTRLAEWLQQQAVERGDHREALAWAQQLFWQQPSLGRFRQVKAPSQAIGSWPELQAELIRRLEEGKQYSLLTEIYLDEGQVDRAIEAVKWVRSDRWMGYQTELLTQVAEAAEETRPREAIGIYVECAQECIGLRGRDNYVAAAAYLSRVRNLYRRLGEEPSWQALIAEIRGQNTRLRALKEELNRAGL